MRIALVGYGRMGRAVEEVARARGHEIVATLDLADNPTGEGLSKTALEGAELAMEFTSPGAAVRNLVRLAELGVDVVCGTTGWSESLPEVTRAVEEAGTGLIHSPNFSVGVQLFFRLSELAGSLGLGMGGYRPMIGEIHHTHKVDSPSGTARRLAEMILRAAPTLEGWRLVSGGEEPGEGILGITAVRSGENPGEHLFALDGVADRIEVRHQAKSRAGFAQGAVDAGEWVRGRRGVFSFEEMLEEKWS